MVRGSVKWGIFDSKWAVPFKVLFFSLFTQNKVEPHFPMSLDGSKSFGELYIYLLSCRHFHGWTLRLHADTQPAPVWCFPSFPDSYFLDVNMLPDGWPDETQRPPGLLRALKIESVWTWSANSTQHSLRICKASLTVSPSNEEGPDYRVNNSYWVQFNRDGERGKRGSSVPHTQSSLLQSLTTAELSSTPLHMSYCFIKGHTCSSFHSAQASPACSFWDAPLIILRCSSHWSPSWLLIAVASASSSLRW